MLRVTSTVLRDLVRLSYDSDVPLFVFGNAGIGKSTILETCAVAMGIESRVIDLSVMEPTDLLGLPRIENGVTSYARPAFLPTSGKGLLIFEELNRAPAYTRIPVLEFLSRRAIHDHPLPKGWLPVAAANPDGADYSVDILDPAFMTRFTVVELVADRRAWLAWAREKCLHPAVLSYVEAAPDFFETSGVCPRALELASRHLKSADALSLRPDDPALGAALGGVLGSPIAMAVLRFLIDRSRPIEADDILTKYPGIQPLVRRLVSQRRLDLIQATIAKLEEHLDSGRWSALKRRPTSKRNLESFLADIPPDLRKLFWVKLAHKGVIEPVEA